MQNAVAAIVQELAVTAVTEKIFNRAWSGIYECVCHRRRYLFVIYYYDDALVFVVLSLLLIIIPILLVVPLLSFGLLLLHTLIVCIRTVPLSTTALHTRYHT